MQFQSIFREGLFADQVILVTGGGSGIGRCITHELASLGATVHINGRTEEKLQRVASEISQSGGSVDWSICDIREEDQVEKLFETILQKHGRLNSLVNNAGGQFPSPLEKMTKKGWDAVIRNNLMGTFLVSQQAFKTFFGENGGNIVNIVADFSRGMPLIAHTGAARAGVDNLTKTASIEWAKYGIRVNSVAPGLTSTSGQRAYGEKFLKIMEERKNGYPQEIGHLNEISAAFLLYLRHEYMTGTIVRVMEVSLAVYGSIRKIEAGKVSTIHLRNAGTIRFAETSVICLASSADAFREGLRAFKCCLADSIARSNRSSAHRCPYDSVSRERTRLLLARIDKGAHFRIIQPNQRFFHEFIMGDNVVDEAQFLAFFSTDVRPSNHTECAFTDLPRQTIQTAGRRSKSTLARGSATWPGRTQDQVAGECKLEPPPIDHH